MYLKCILIKCESNNDQLPLVVTHYDFCSNFFDFLRKIGLKIVNSNILRIATFCEFLAKF